MKRVLERLLNLLVYLRTAESGISADDIRFTVPGYDPDNDVAFHRMFERDKDLLRGMGIALLTRQGDDEGPATYSLPASDYELTDPGLTDEERAALWLATRMVHVDGIDSDGALLKLGGVQPTTVDAPEVARIRGDAETLALLLGAARDHQRVRFSYRERRHTASPLGVLNQRGHWYLVGAGEDRPRPYRVSRGSDWELVGEKEAFVPPPKMQLRDALPEAPWEMGDEKLEAELLFDDDVAWRASNELGSAFTATPRGMRTTIRVGNTDALVGWILEYGSSAEIIGPPELRNLMIARLSP